MEKHVTLVGVLHIVYHSLGFVIGIVIFGILTTIGRLAGDPEAAVILGIVGTAVGTFLIVLSVPGIVGGIALLKKRPWGRILAMVVGIIDIVDIPLGTALGVYTLWVLMHDETMQIFQEGTPAPVLQTA